MEITNNYNINNVSNQIKELNITEIEKKYTINNINSYFDENTVDFLATKKYSSINIENENLKIENICNQTNDVSYTFDEYYNYKYNRKPSKSYKKNKSKYKSFNNSNEENNKSDGLCIINCFMIKEEENFQKRKIFNTNHFNKEQKNSEIEFSRSNKTITESSNIKNDLILNFDPYDKNFNYSIKRYQTVKIIKEGILKKKSNWFHYNTRKVILDTTPIVEYIDPILNKVKVKKIYSLKHRI